MKKHLSKRLLSLLLALVLCVGLVVPAAAAGTSADALKKTEVSAVSGKLTAEGETSTETKKAQPKEPKGFRDPDFLAENDYQYADDETVRAIVVLEGFAEAEASTFGDRRRYRAALQEEHEDVQADMEDIDYELVYDFTTLLNGFSCDVAYGDLDKIADLDYVEAVYIANYYEEPVLENPQSQEPEMKYAGGNSFTGNNSMNTAGFDGEGMVIAVLDTGTRVTHEAFKDTSLVDATVVTEASVEAAIKNNVNPGVYVSAKIPFAYDYADNDADVADHNGHGTHVAGIATGYVPTTDGGAKFSGAAPAAQLLAMKVFHDDQPGTSSDIYFKALEDAYKLGADVINMSLGSPGGFTYDSELETEIFGNIYQTLANAGVVVCIAAGNEYSMAEYSSMGYIGPEYADYGTVASPSTYTGALSIASMENAAYPAYVLEFPDKTTASYVDSSEDSLWLSTFAGEGHLDYVVVPNVGAPEDYAEIDVKDKIALVTRGSITFEEKVENAAAAGAIGCIICDNAEGLPISMQIETFEVPAIYVSKAVGEHMKAAEDKWFSVPTDTTDVPNPAAGSMSDFSNWGPDPMLEIKPNFTSVGGMVWSSVNSGDQAYDVYSGTSMAAPNAAGTYANVLQFLKEQGITDKRERAELATALLESSATTLGGITEDYEFWFYSVRKQGAGIANSNDARDAYLNSAFITNPLQELGDNLDQTGITMQLELKNAGTEDVTLTPFSILMVDDLATYKTITYNSLTTRTYASLGQQSGVTFTYSIGGETVTETVTVPAKSTVKVDVTVTLGSEVKAYLEKFENGAYVEGYVSFQNYDGHSSAQAAFLGFYGDWTEGPVLEQADFRDYLDANYFANTVPVDEEGNTYADYGYTGWDLLDYYTSPNMGYAAYMPDYQNIKLRSYLGDSMLDLVPFYEEHMAFSTPMSNADYFYANAFVLIPYQLRNARHLVMTVTNAETGEVYYVDDTEFLPKAAYDEESSSWQAYGVFAWDGTDKAGEYVPSGTVAHVQFDAVIPYGYDEYEDTSDSWSKDEWSFDVTVDYTAPEILSCDLDRDAGTLTVKATDDQYLQAIYLTDDNGEILDYETFSYSADEKAAMEASGEVCEAQFDVSLYLPFYNIAQLHVFALDYATNETEETADLIDIGLPATITMVTPAGETKYEMKTGDLFVFPACDAEYENAQFLVWTRTSDPYLDDYEIWFVDGMYFEGDAMVVTGDDTFYALYAVGESVPLEKADYYAVNGVNYAGEWAIAGLNITGSGFDIMHPQALGANGEKVDVASLPDAEIDEDYIEFYTNETGIRFTFSPVGDGEYTVRNVQTGKYLALVNGEIAMVDAVTDAAKWTVVSNTASVAASKMFNVAQPDMCLVYDDEAGAFAVYDDTVPYFNYNGTDYYPSDWFYLWLYKCEDSVLIPDHYSSALDTALRQYYEQVEGMKYDGYSWLSWSAFLGALENAKAVLNDENATQDDINAALAELQTAVSELKKGLPVSFAGSTITKPTEPMGFTDVSTSDAYYDAVKYVYEEGLMNGVSDTRFAPESTLTRAMVVTILYRIEGEPSTRYNGMFPDVANYQWYTNAVEWAAKNNIVTGYTTGKFGPEDPVTREQLAAILYRYAQSKGCVLPEGAGLSGYADGANVSSYAVTAVKWAVAEGILEAQSGKLQPRDAANRAQVAIAVAAFHQKYVK